MSFKIEIINDKYKMDNNVIDNSEVKLINVLGISVLTIISLLGISALHQIQRTNIVNHQLN